MSFVLPVVVTVLVVSGLIAFALWKKKKTTNYTQQPNPAKNDSEPEKPLETALISAPKLPRTMLKALATLEVTIHFDEEQLDQIATIVTERQGQLQKLQTSVTAKKESTEETSTETVPSSAETVQSEEKVVSEGKPEVASEETSEAATSEEPSRVPLIRHAKIF